jgi:hypothetical protein
MSDRDDYLAYAASAIDRVPKVSHGRLKEDDPILEEQIHVLVALLGGPVSDEELDGFLVVHGRLVDDFGRHRTDELADVFRTSTPEGRAVLRESLRYVNRWVGGYAGYETRYPVTAKPARPAFPLFQIVGVDQIAKTLYRVFDSGARIGETDAPLRELIMRSGHLPEVPEPSEPVLRAKPRFHWCSYTAWDSPAATREALQILPEWKSDCRVRASIAASSVSHSTFVAFNGDSDPNEGKLKFVGYFFEPKAQDHDAMEGGGLQLGVAGAPRVSLLEEWSEREGAWNAVWRG